MSRAGLVQCALCGRWKKASRTAIAPLARAAPYLKPGFTDRVVVVEAGSHVCTTHPTLEELRETARRNGCKMPPPVPAHAAALLGDSAPTPPRAS